MFPNGASLNPPISQKAKCLVFLLHKPPDIHQYGVLGHGSRRQIVPLIHVFFRKDVGLGTLWKFSGQGITQKGHLGDVGLWKAFVLCQVA